MKPRQEMRHEMERNIIIRSCCVWLWWKKMASL